MTSRVTVAVIPRERFSMAARALDVLYERTDFPVLARLRGCRLAAPCPPRDRGAPAGKGLPSHPHRGLPRDQRVAEPGARPREDAVRGLHRQRRPRAARMAGGAGPLRRRDGRRPGGAALLHRPPGGRDGAHGGRHRRPRGGERPAALPRAACAARPALRHAPADAPARDHRAGGIPLHAGAARRLRSPGPARRGPPHRQRASGPLRVGAAGRRRRLPRARRGGDLDGAAAGGLVGSRLLPAPLERRVEPLHPLPLPREMAARRGPAAVLAATTGSANTGTGASASIGCARGSVACWAGGSAPGSGPASTWWCAASSGCSIRLLARDGRRARRRLDYRREDLTRSRAAAPVA